MTEPVDVERLRALAWDEDGDVRHALRAAAAELTTLRDTIRGIIGDYEVTDLADESDEQIMTRAIALWALKDEHTTLRAENKALREKDTIAAQQWRNFSAAMDRHKDESPYDEESWTLLDESFQKKCAELKAAEAKLQEAERDAERYRWLREQHGTLALVMVKNDNERPYIWSEPTIEELDPAIDAARAVLATTGESK
jgi:hypothetical protein